MTGPEPPRLNPGRLRLRQGTKVGRTLYQIRDDDSEELIGVVDTPELAALIVQRVNAQEPDQKTTSRWLVNATPPGQAILEILHEPHDTLVARLYFGPARTRLFCLAGLAAADEAQASQPPAHPDMQHVLIVGELHADGSSTSRSWPIRAALAEALAQALGTPHSEAVASAEQVRAAAGIAPILTAEPCGHEPDRP